MRRILAVGLVLVVPAVAYAQTVDGDVKGPVQRYAVLESHVQQKTAQQKVLPPLRLPLPRSFRPNRPRPIRSRRHCPPARPPRPSPTRPGRP